MREKLRRVKKGEVDGLDRRPSVARRCVIGDLNTSDDASAVVGGSVKSSDRSSEQLYCCTDWWAVDESWCILMGVKRNGEQGKVDYKT